MKNLKNFLFITVVGGFSAVLPGFAQGTAFTYQGRLNDGANPAAGVYDLRFTIYDSTNLPGVVIAGPLTNSTTAVSNGLFTVTLDFGAGVFTGPSRWLEIGVRTNGATTFAALAPRQSLTPTPYAVMAGSASNLLGTFPASQLSGTIPSADLTGAYGNAVNFNNGADTFNGTFVGQFFGSSFFGGSFNGSFFGDGSGLYNLNASQLASGTVPDARLAGNVVRTNQVWLLNGNAGTIPGTNFIGTTDNQPLIIMVNGQEAERYEPTTDTPNVVGGYSGNYVQPGLPGVTIGGGGTVLGNQPNVVTNNGFYATIAGGYRNTVTNYGGAILGGSVNFAGGNFAVIGGGQFDTSLGDYSFIGGGYNNTIFSPFGFIGGGQGNSVGVNTTNGPGFIGHAAVVGGDGNQANGILSFVGGGLGNIASGLGSAVLGGNVYNYTNGTVYYLFGTGATGTSAVVVGGLGNHANGDFSFAAGSLAQANHSGTFVWADSAYPNIVPFSSTTSNEFSIRAQNGVRIQTDAGIHLNAADEPIIVRDWDVFATNAPGYKAGIGRWGLFMEPFNLTLGIPGDDLPGRSFQIVKYSTNGVYTPLMVVDQSGNITTAGSISGGALSGTYGNPVTLNNAGNSFTGDGTGLNNVNAVTLNGFSSGAFAPASGSGNYIQNQTAAPQSASFDINGSAQIAGLLRSGVENGTAEAPSPAGLVIRRINSTLQNSNSVVAISRINGTITNVTLIRDGTSAGFQIQYPAALSGRLTIACMGIDSTGAQKNFYTSITGPAVPGVVQVYTNSQNIVHFECSFGDPFSNTHLTQVMLTRYATDYFWDGTVISTVNQ